MKQGLNYYQLNLISTNISVLSIINATNQVQSFLLFIKQAGSGNKAINWPANIKFGVNTPDISITNINKTDVIQLITSDQGLTWFGTIIVRNV